MNVKETFKTPIRAISMQPCVWGSGTTTYGLFIIYEEANGNADFVFCDQQDITEGQVRFIDMSEDSCIVWRTVEEKAGVFGNKKTIKRELVEIRLRRDFQSKP